MKLRFARLALAARGLGLLLLATCVGDIPTSSSPLSAPLAPPISAATTSTSSALLIGAGNVARCDRANDEATGLLLDAYPSATVFTAGDNINGNGSLTDFNNCYGPSWGRNKARTRPSVGDMDYKTKNALGFFQYFGAAGGDSAKYYYSYDLGAWHIMVLNSRISMAAGSPQEQWLRAQLAANTKGCTLAYWHDPRFSSTGTNNLASVKPLWDALYAYNADVVVNAQYYVYERFAPQSPTAVADPSGIREFIVGNGGVNLQNPGAPKPNSQVRNGTAYGVLKFTLDSLRYAWQFLPVAGQTFTDTGSTACHTRILVASVDVTPPSASLVVNGTVQLTATPKDAAGNPLAGHVVTWASSDTTVAKVDGNGLVTGKAIGGPVTIRATSEGKTGTSAITVTVVPVATVDVTPASASILVNATVQLAATPKDTNGNPLTGRAVTWTSSDTSVAKVGATGLVTGKAAGGPVTITATSEGKSGTSGITVTPIPVASVDVIPPSASIQVNATVQLTATPKDSNGTPLTGRAITWATSNAAIATVNATGLVTGHAVGGPVTITATSEGKNGTSAITVTPALVASVDVTPPSAGILAGATVQLTATPKDANGNPLTGRTITWQSSETGVAGVNSTGLVYGLSAGSATITATSEGQSGTAALTVTGSSPVLVGAGDIASCTSSGDEATANLLDTIPGTVFTVGDDAYQDGSAADFANCYGPTWGRQRARTRPTPGNHEYHTAGAPGYFGYFGAAAGDPAKGYYSYDLGEWHVVVLNNYVPMTAGSAQEQWLRADLAANTKPCTIGMWHEPMFSDGPHGGVTGPRPLWQALYDWGAEIVLSGHDHVYERFAPQRADGTADPALGIREFLIGIGGESHDGFHSNIPNGEARIGDVYGVLKLTLQPGGYTWQFVPEAGKTATDQGSGTCHGYPPPVANPGGPYATEGAVTFDGTASYDPQGDAPLTYAWTFGDGATGSGATPTHTYAATGDYTVTLVVTDSKGNSSVAATTTVTIGNLAPSVNAGPDWSIIAGETVNLSASFTDNPSDTPWNYTISWGDGSATESGTASSAGSPIASSHAYASSGQYTLQVSVTDLRGATGSDNAIVNVAEANAPRVLVGAGDITRCDRTDDEATAALLDNISGTVFTIGDNVMGNSTTVPDFPNCYDPSWGRHKARTHPAPGHMEYWVTGAASYFDYFGAAAGEAGKGYYSYDLGAWHVIVLNSNLATSVGSAQELWLQADLAASTKQCTVAIWHLPLFSSAGAGFATAATPLWNDLYAAGAELVLNAHDEVYERFAPQTPDGVADPTGGIRQFTVGTGGIGSNPFGTIQPNSEARSSGTPGVLKLTLATTGYSWQFVPIAGRTFTDSGSGSCH